jgi:HEAT repeat protein
MTFDQEKLQKVKQRLNHESSFIRRRAVRKAANFPSKEILEILLLMLLTEEKEKIRLSVVQTLEQFPVLEKTEENRIIKALEQTASNDPIKKIQQAAEKALALRSS